MARGLKGLEDLLLQALFHSVVSAQWHDVRKHPLRPRLKQDQTSHNMTFQKGIETAVFFFW